MKKLLSFALVCLMLLPLAVPAFADFYTWPEFEFRKSQCAFDAAKYVTSYVCTKEKSYKPNDKAHYKVTAYSYDKNGHLTKVQQASKMQDEFDSRDPGEITTYRYTGKSFKYNKAGNLTGDGTVKCVYNSNGRLIRKTELDPAEGEGFITTAYSYDSNGRMTKASKTKNGKSAGTDSFAYNKAGLLTKAVYNTLYDTMTTTTVNLAYNAQNNITKQVVAVKDSGYTDKSTDVYKYDSAGRLISDPFGKYAYDSKGRLIQKTVWHEKIIYTYDKNNNLMKKVESQKDDGKWVDNWITVYTYKKLEKKICKIDVGTGLKCVDGHVFSDANKSVNLAKYKYTYTGKAIKPKVTIDSLQPGADYYVQYANNVKPGKARIIIRYIDGSPSTIIYFHILPRS